MRFMLESPVSAVFNALLKKNGLAGVGKEESEQIHVIVPMHCQEPSGIFLTVFGHFIL